MLSAPASQVSFDANGLIVAIVQEVSTGTVLMVAYMDSRALELTLDTGEAHFFSRSRGALWRKGESSGAVLDVVSIQSDCDGDALLLGVHPRGPTCHTGQRSCFSEPVTTLERLGQTLEDRRLAAVGSSYTAALLEAGVPGIARKVGEEAVEVILAGYEDDADHLVAEVADLCYHSAVLLLAKGRPLSDVLRVLEERQCSTDVEKTR